jgi:hypothetical protein
MSLLPSESLEEGALVCIYPPLCVKQHAAWKCVRLANLPAEHKRAVARAKGVCLACNAASLQADGWCGECGRNGAQEPPSLMEEVQVQRLQPLWSLVMAGKNQYFYMCKVQAESRFRREGIH